MKKLSKLLVGTIAATSMAGAAQAQSLFQDMALDDVQTTAAVQLEGQIRSRQVSVIESDAKDLFRESALSRTLSLSLMSGVKIELERTDLDMDFGEGSRSWSGRVRGYEDGFATFVSDKIGRVNGHVQYGGQTFRITPGYGGIHTISEIVTEDLPQEEAIDFLEASDHKAPPSYRDTSYGAISQDFTTQAWPSVIDVLVIYTDEAVAEAVAAGTTAKDEAILALSMAKTAMINTGLKTHRFRWRGYRGMGGCGYADPSSTTTLLLNISPGRPEAVPCIRDHAIAKRNQVSADMVAVVKGSGGCGTAWYSSAGVSADRAYSVTARPCISQHTFTHELGHNLGLTHDRYTTGEEGNGTNQAAFNYGLTHPTAASPFRTVMAYNNKCSDQNIFCTRVPVFTNSAPNGMWNGVRTGRGLHLSDSALSRKTLINNWNTISAHR